MNDEIHKLEEEDMKLSQIKFKENALEKDKRKTAEKEIKLKERNLYYKKISLSDKEKKNEELRDSIYKIHKRKETLIKKIKVVNNYSRILIQIINLSKLNWNWKGKNM